jgi:hypothetical protein
MTMQSIQLATVSGVVSMIEKVADLAIKENKQAPEGMMSAMDAVCNLLEAKGKGDKQLLAVVAKVRQACNLKKGKPNDSLV